MEIHKIFKIIIVSSLLILCRINNVGAFKGFDTVSPLSYSNKTEVVTIPNRSDGQSETVTFSINKYGKFWVQYKIRIKCTYSYNDNTYKITSAKNPVIIEDMLVFSSQKASSIDLQNMSVGKKIANDKKSVKFTWSFDIVAHHPAKDVVVKSISGSKTCKP